MDISTSVIENGLALTMAILLLIYLGAEKLGTAARLKEADAKREADRKEQLGINQSNADKQTSVMEMIAKSNQNIADALTCVRMTLETSIGILKVHDERAIVMDKTLTEMCTRMEDNKGGK